MQFVRHLSDQELTDLILEDDERYFRQVLAALPGSLRIAAERPESFWQRQQAAIRARIAAIERSARPILVARAAAVMLAVVALFLLQSPPAPAPVSRPAESDQQLLLSVERSVHSDVPQALEPAALLADDVFSGVHYERVSQNTRQGEQK
jgi:hypothetical protein